MYSMYVILFTVSFSESLIQSSISFYEGHLTTKSDVYSFGVVLLEMLTGRRVIDKNRPTGEHNLIPWAKPYLTNKRRIMYVMDARIQGQYTVAQALRAASLALKCLSVEPKSRPEMDQVVKDLEQLQDMKISVNGKSEGLQKHRGA